MFCCGYIAFICLNANTSFLRLVKTITEVVGDYNFSADFASSAAAIHAKCLICDKPVSSQRARTANANNRPNNGGNAVMMSRSLSQAGYDKADDDLQQQKKQSMQSSSIIKRINSPNPAVSKSAKAKVLSEMTIIRSTIEPLPEINVRLFLHMTSMHVMTMLIGLFH